MKSSVCIRPQSLKSELCEASPLANEEQGRRQRWGRLAVGGLQALTEDAKEEKGEFREAKRTERATSQRATAESRPDIDGDRIIRESVRRAYTQLVTHCFSHLVSNCTLCTVHCIGKCPYLLSSSVFSPLVGWSFVSGEGD